MNCDEINPRIETTDEKLERYKDFKKRYYIYRVDDIINYIKKKKLCIMI